MNGDRLFSLIRSMMAVPGRRPVTEAAVWKACGKTLTMVIFDCVGFTRYTRTHGTLHVLRKLLTFRRLMESVLRRHRAFSHRFHADNLHAEFRRPLDAFSMVADAYRTLSQSGLTMTETEPFQISVGIGMGHVLHTHSEGPFDDEMNSASKLGEDVAGPDELVLTHAAYRALPRGMKRRFKERRHTTSGVVLLAYHCPLAVFAAQMPGAGGQRSDVRAP